jgi:LPPG:FO 2-phospho-L-lactate transferase
VREALAAAPARVVAVSPFVGGRAVKGPTEAFMAHAGQPCNAAGAAALVPADAVIGDDPSADHVTGTLMPDAAAARRLAAETLDFASSL